MHLHILEFSLNLLVPMFSEWLLLKDLALMDSAVCCKVFRPKFLEIISHNASSISDVCTFNFPSHVTDSEEKIRMWVEKRDVTVDTMNICAEDLLELQDMIAYGMTKKFRE